MTNINDSITNLGATNQFTAVQFVSDIVADGVTLNEMIKLGVAGLIALILTAVVMVGIGAVIALGISFIKSLVTFIPKTVVKGGKPKILDILTATYQSAYIMVKEIITQRFISAIVFFSVVIALLAVGAFSLIGENFNSYINDSFASDIPPNMIKVTPKDSPGMSLFGIKLNRPEGTVLSDAYVNEIYYMEGVEKIHPFMALDLPMLVKLPSVIYGQEFWMDVVAIGAPYNMIKTDLDTAGYRSLWLDWEEGDDVPVMIPDNIINAYNDSYAAINGMPQISEELVIGAASQICFGKSSMKEYVGYQILDATLFGFTESVDDIAMVVPLNVARHYNELFGGNTADEEYIYCYVSVENHDALITVSEKIAEWGFVVEAETSLSEDLNSLKEVVNKILSAMMFIILVLAVIAIAFSTTIATMNRLDYYRVLRIMGSSKIFISLIIVLKYVLLGYIGARFSMIVIQFGSDFIQEAFSTVIASLPIGDLTLDFSLTDDVSRRMLLFGSLIPLISTAPAIVKLYTRALNRD